MWTARNFISSEGKPAAGRAMLRTIIFALLSIALLVMVLSFRSDENKIFDDAKKVKIGMTQKQVFEIMGSPKRREKAPFLEERSPSGDIPINENNTSEKISRAVQRDRYELLWFTSGNKADIWDFDIYYDAELKVCCLNRLRTDGWVLIE